MIDGRGDPNTSPAFAEAVGALYPVAYKLKFASKRDLGRDYVVPPLEGLWWADDTDAFTTARDQSRWNWTIMLMVPDWIDRALFAMARRDFAGWRVDYDTVLVTLSGLVMAPLSPWSSDRGINDRVRLVPSGTRPAR